MKKKIFEVFVVSFLFIFLMGFISAENCIITERANCADEIVMGLSSLTNAHGELTNSSNYNFVLCCDFGYTTSCDGNNQILKLSDSTNAHAESPSETNYNFDVCYGEFECYKTTEDCDTNEMAILSLSSSTNAHIGKFENYSNKICCDNICEGGLEYLNEKCELKQAYWASTNNDFLDNAKVVPDTTKVSMILQSLKSLEGTEVFFEIYEDDLFFDDEIRTGDDALSGIVDSSGSAKVLWSVLLEDLEKTNDYEGFYFKVNGEESNELNITLLTEGFCTSINFCVDYFTKEGCESDICVTAEESVRLNDQSAICNQIEINMGGCEIWSDCGCIWENNSCSSNKMDRIELNCSESTNSPSEIGSCSYHEVTNDTCEDGFLTYSFDGIYKWSGKNNFSSNPDGNDYINDSLGFWHYDPDRKSEDCTGGENIVQCPAQIQLPFFNVYGIIAVILLIIAGYVFMKRKKPKKKSKNKKRK